MSGRFLYVFLDEAGNLDFSPTGTKYFILGAITKERPFHCYKDLTELKYDLAELGANVEYFHCSEDAQATRNRVFSIIKTHLAGVRIDALVVEKRKTGPALRAEEEFYPRMLGFLLKYILNGQDLAQFAEVIVFTDQIPVQKKRNAVEKTIKMTLASELPKTARYRIMHHASKSNMDLQIADYCTWAVYRKWESGDYRSDKEVMAATKSEFDIFQTGTRLYY